MRIKKVWAVYFSGTGTTKKTVRRIAAGMAQALDAELAVYDFTTPAARQRELRFGTEELAVLGVPVYAGRVPNVLLPYLTKQLHGGGALAVGSDLIQSCGPDSYPGRVAAVMLGSTETTFYTVAVYFGAAGILRTRYAIPAALTADLAGFAASALTVRLFFGP